MSRKSLQQPEFILVGALFVVVFIFVFGIKIKSVVNSSQSMLISF